MEQGITENMNPRSFASPGAQPCTVANPSPDGTPTAQTSNADDPRAVRYATRQPILTAGQKVIGYKLLFRTGVESYFTGDSACDKGRAAIDLSSLLGLSTLCDNRYGFISCSREVLLGDYLALLPPDKVVAEIPGAVLPSAGILHACRQLKDAGYRIALGDFILDDPREPLTAFADFIKVDISRTPLEDAEKIVSSHRARNTRMLAQNVETREDFERTREAGFRYFQGYFFRKPEKVRARSLSSSHVTGLQLLQAASKAEMDWQEIEEIIRHDAMLFYRLLRWLNSVAFAYRGEVHSVHQALMILGENEFRRWCRLAVLFETSQSRPSDLFLSALVRARFAELLGEKIAHGDADLFLLGMLSLMDAILEIPMGQVLDGLPLAPETRTLLLEHKGALSPVFRLIFAVEAGAWRAVLRSCIELQLEEEFVAASYQSAMEWAQTIANNT